MLNTTKKPKEITRSWFIVDAKGETLGRLSTNIATVLQGKHRPYYSPQWDMGDHIVVINAEHVALTGNKELDKEYFSYSGYPGGDRTRTVAQMRQTKPTFIIEHAVKGMMPKNTLAKDMMQKLHVYAGEDHPHGGQDLEELPRK